MTELKLAEIKQLLEQKYKHHFKFRTEKLSYLAEWEARYDPASDEIIVGRELRGRRRLVDIAHEVGHKLHGEELKAKGKPFIKTRETALDIECEAYQRGFEVAELLHVKQEFIEKWRSDYFPLCIPCHCPAPGDEKIACGEPFSVSDKPDATYNGKEFIDRVNIYKKIGKWHRK